MNSKRFIPLSVDDVAVAFIVFIICILASFFYHGLPLAEAMSFVN